MTSTGLVDPTQPFAPAPGGGVATGGFDPVVVPFVIAVYLLLVVSVTVAIRRVPSPEVAA